MSYSKILPSLLIGAVVVLSLGISCTPPCDQSQNSSSDFPDQCDIKNFAMVPLPENDTYPLPATYLDSLVRSARLLCLESSGFFYLQQVPCILLATSLWLSPSRTISDLESTDRQIHCRPHQLSWCPHYFGSDTRWWVLYIPLDNTTFCRLHQAHCIPVA